jgi:integrase
VLAWLTLGGLCGLRPFEVLRLDWSAIQWETKEIRIEPYLTKTKRARTIPIQANALEWLRIAFESTAGEQDAVLPPESTWTNRWRRWRKANHDLAWWGGKDDVLRHSFGTYRAAVLRNAHSLAEEMGNSVEMVRTHYDAVVSPSVARHWWAIQPEKPKNVVSIAAA